VNTIGVVLLVLLLAYAAFLGYRWKIENTPPTWTLETFELRPGQDVYVFMEPRLVLFLGDEGPFDWIGSRGEQTFCIGATGTGYSQRDTRMIYQFSSNRRVTTMQFLDGKSEMKLNFMGAKLGTKLTLDDGREFNLKESSPLWLRVKDDGTILELDELPEGFVEFFESPSPDPDLRKSIKSYPDAFRKE